MKESCGPTWFVTALCTIVLVGTVFIRLEAVAILLFCFLPVVFCQMSLTLQTSKMRVDKLEDGGE